MQRHARATAITDRAPIVTTRSPALRAPLSSVFVAAKLTWILWVWSREIIQHAIDVAAFNTLQLAIADHPFRTASPFLNAWQIPEFASLIDAFFNRVIATRGTALGFVRAANDWARLRLACPTASIDACVRCHLRSRLAAPTEQARTGGQQWHQWQNCALENSGYLLAY